jgi:hypothetical protein
VLVRVFWVFGTAECGSFLFQICDVFPIIMINRLKGFSSCYCWSSDILNLMGIVVHWSVAWVDFPVLAVYVVSCGLFLELV